MGGSKEELVKGTEERALEGDWEVPSYLSCNTHISRCNFSESGCVLVTSGGCPCLTGISELAERGQ